MSISSLIESVLTAHPAVSAAAVSVHGTEGGGEQLVAHVVPGDPVAAVAVAGEEAQIAGWRRIHEALYGGAGAAGTGAGAVVESVYDGLPIPAAELREWREAALERVRGLPRRRILEIGAGGGLLMDRLARQEEVEEYWAADFAASAVAALAARTQDDPVLRDKVRLRRQDAGDISGLPAGHFELVVLDSVVQYFPSLAHLRTVLERVLPLLAPGGSVLLGGLRNLDLARCLAAGVELARPGAADGDREELRRSVERRLAAETELLLSPGLFPVLARELPGVRTVDVRVRRGTGHNELTRYRYDVLLSTAAPAADLTAAPVVRWGREVSCAAEAEDRLNTHRPAVLRLAGVPNRRVHDEYGAMLALDNPLESVDLAPQDAPAPGLEALCAAGEHLGYRALATWSGQGAELLDVVFVDPDLVPPGPLTGVYVAPAAAVVEECAGTPAALEGTVDLAAVLRGHLRERLGDHLVPSALTTLDALPLNADGSVDRAALPEPAPVRGVEAFAASAPGTPVQEIVRDLFAEVLGLARREVHAGSDFFRLGGDDEDARRLLARVRETLDADPGGRALHGAPTPAALAALLGDLPAAATGPGGAGTDSAVLPLRLRGPLDQGALAQALQDLGRRHEALRNSRLGAAGTRLRALGAEDHLLYLALPAACVDLWSHLPLAAELARAYGARVGGGVPYRSPAGLDAAPRTVFGDLPPTPLPGSVPQAGAASYGTLEAELDGELHERLTRFAAERGSTLFMVVHTALTAVLSRLGAPAEVTVAAPVPARDSAALRGAVGPYGRVLALSVDTSGDPAFAELLRRVRESDLAAYRDPGSALAVPPGGVALSVLQETDGAFEAAGLTVRPQGGELPLPAADLGLTLTERQTGQGAPAGVGVLVAYRHETVGEAAAASLTGQLTAVLEAALDEPETALSRLRLEPGTADGGVWAGESAVLPARSVAELFAAQVERAPEAIALAGLSYGELDARSDLLAHALIAHRAGPGTSVLTALSSPVGFAVAALAVAKAGAALLPVDPALDLDESVGPVVLLLDETADLVLPPVAGAARLVRDDAADRLPATGRWPVTDADRTRPLRADEAVLLVPGEDGTVVVGPEAVAAATLSDAADAAWLVRGYPDADVTLGLLGALVCGARVHLPDGALAQAVPHEVLRWLRQEGARVVLGGADDALAALVALAWTEGDELAVSGGWAEGRFVIEQLPGGPPRPAPGYRAYVLDARMRPVAPGETGALYIAGAGVAQGYAGDPAATGERFLPDPVAAADGRAARMWRTGRAARMSADGMLRVLDRPAQDDPFADDFATFTVLADTAGHHALWPASVPAPQGWSETHPEDLYELCLDHINERLGHPF
ncbi:AMP-binding protein [Streptomyces sp. NPDC086787]|uniref:AMP-binding protein n=1 Tax=Streptomyces sp. NPDC086787 TaxID=3365759 RepID=UPI0037F8BBA9